MNIRAVWHPIVTTLGALLFITLVLGTLFAPRLDPTEVQGRHEVVLSTESGHSLAALVAPLKTVLSTAGLASDVTLSDGQHQVRVLGEPGAVGAYSLQDALWSVSEPHKFLIRASRLGATTAIPPQSADSCRFARDGECDQPPVCPSGTDTTDCRGAAQDPLVASVPEVLASGTHLSSCRRLTTGGIQLEFVTHAFTNRPADLALEIVIHGDAPIAATVGHIRRTDALELPAGLLSEAQVSALEIVALTRATPLLVTAMVVPPAYARFQARKFPW